MPRIWGALTAGPGPPEERPASWSIFSASQELEAVKNALDGNISVWVDSAKDTRWLLFGPTEGVVRQARDTVKGRGKCSSTGASLGYASQQIRIRQGEVPLPKCGRSRYCSVWDDGFCGARSPPHYGR